MEGGIEMLNKALQKLLQAVKPLGGATTAAAALENLGAASEVLLWENASPSSAFAAQTVSGNYMVEDDEYIEIEFCVSSYMGGSKRVSINALQSVGALEGINSAANATTYIGSRIFTAYSDGIVFETGYYKSSHATTAGAGVADSNTCKPVRIWKKKR